MKKGDLAYYNLFTIERVVKLYLVKVEDVSQERVSVEVIKKIYDNQEDIDVEGNKYNFPIKRVDSLEEFFAKSHKLIHWIFSVLGEK